MGLMAMAMAMAMVAMNGDGSSVQFSLPHCGCEHRRFLITFWYKFHERVPPGNGRISVRRLEIEKPSLLANFPDRRKRRRP